MPLDPFAYKSDSISWYCNTAVQDNLQIELEEAVGRETENLKGKHKIDVVLWFQLYYDAVEIMVNSKLIEYDIHN